MLTLTLISLAFAEEPVEIQPTQDAPEADGDDSFDFETGIEVWSESWESGDSVWGDTYDTPVGDVYWDVLGYDASASTSAGFDDGNVEVSASAEAQVYVAQVGYEGELYYGSEETHASIGAEAEAAVGAEASVNAEVEVGLEGVELEGGAEAFAGAKAEGEIPVDLAVCDVGFDASVGGEASAGIGGTAEGEVEADWSNLEFGFGGELAGTLGLGLGGEGEFTLDLGGILDPAGTADCFWDYAWEAGEFVVSGADAIWDTGWDLGSDALGGLAVLGGSVFVGLFGGGGGDDDSEVIGKFLSKAVVATLDEVNASIAQELADRQNAFVSRLDHQLTPGHGRVGQCF